MKGGYCRLRDRSVELSKARAVIGKFWCLKHGGEDIENGRIKHAIIGSHNSLSKREISLQRGRSHALQTPIALIQILVNLWYSTYIFKPPNPHPS